MEKLKERLFFAWFLKNAKHKSETEIHWMLSDAQLPKIAEQLWEYISQNYDIHTFDDMELRFLLPHGKVHTTEIFQKTLKLYAFEIKTLVLQKRTAKLMEETALKNQVR